MGVANGCAFAVEVSGGDSLGRARAWTLVSAGQATVAFDTAARTILLRTGPRASVVTVAIETAELKEPLPIAGRRYADLEFFIAPEVCAQLPAE